MIDPGFTITLDPETMVFNYGNDSFGPEMEKRHLNDIRKSLEDSKADGPDVLYSIAMDVGKKKDREDLNNRGLLYGAVIYAKGRIGKEPVRSQGHIHGISSSCNASTPEVYEIWEGDAIIYMQETATDFPGNCYAVYAKPGDVVIVPPNWAHCTINANVGEMMAFGAWCIRDYCFDYEDIRAHSGLAFYPEVSPDKILIWKHNPKYEEGKLIQLHARTYPEFGIQKGIPIYSQYERNPEIFNFVIRPDSVKQLWEKFKP